MIRSYFIFSEYSRAIVFITAILIIIAFPFGMAFFFFQDSYVILEKGQLLPYTSGEIYKIRLFGIWTFFVEPEIPLKSDIVNSFLLVVNASISLLYSFLFIFFIENKESSRLISMYFILGISCVYLAFDELLGVHESLGHNLQFLADIPFIKRPDDAIILFYMIPAIFWYFGYKKFFLISFAVKRIIFIAAGLIVLSVISDVLSFPRRFEELMEILASGCIVMATLLSGLYYLKRSQFLANT